MKNLKTHPLKSITIEEAKEIQFDIVNQIANNFDGFDFLNRGDLGVKQPGNIPDTTRKVEKTIANIFKTEDAILVTGSGTGALRWGINILSENTDSVLVHDAPIYPTTFSTLKSSKIKPLFVDFNNISLLENTLKENMHLEFAIVQYTRQKLEDSYSYENVIKKIKEINPKIKIMTDDNYAIFKTGNIGTDFGADISTFSSFKVLGPEGVGVIVGKKEIISRIKKENYSGGSQVQGWQAKDVLFGMVYAPVALSIQAETIKKSFEEIKKLNHPEIKDVFIVNAQSKVIIVELKNPIAQKVLKVASKFGALPHPVGAESKYEILPLFYRASGTFRKANPKALDHYIRINPNRSGHQLIIKILKKSIEESI